MFFIALFRLFENILIDLLKEVSFFSAFGKLSGIGVCIVDMYAAVGRTPALFAGKAYASMAFKTLEVDKVLQWFLLKY
jgi:hypothetical protein